MLVRPHSKNMQDKRPKWSVGLSDGSNHHEGKGDFALIDGALSPWRRLLAFIDDKELTITSMAIRSGELAWSLPSIGKNPTFKAFCDAPKPIGYKFFRKLGVNVRGKNKGVEDRFAVIEAQYEGGRTVQVWVDEKTLSSWTLLI